MTETSPLPASGPQPGPGLMRVTESRGAPAAGRYAGRGAKEGGDGTTGEAMRDVIASVPMRGVVVIGKARRTRPRCSTTARRKTTAPINLL